MMYLEGFTPLHVRRSGFFQGRTTMHQHGPNRMFGPLRGTRVWWKGNKDEAPPPDEPKHQRKKSRRTNVEDDDIGAGAIRQALVERVRKEIAAGTYDTDEKWFAALDRFLDRMDKE